MSPLKTVEKKIDEMQINFSHRQLSWSFSWVIQKCVGMSALVNKSKIVFLALTKPYLQLFLQLLFSWQKSCGCETHDATSSKLLNSTNEVNTFLTMWNIIRFSRLSKLVSSNINGSYMYLTRQKFLFDYKLFYLAYDKFPKFNNTNTRFSKTVSMMNFKTQNWLIFESLNFSILSNKVTKLNPRSIFIL